MRLIRRWLTKLYLARYRAPRDLLRSAFDRYPERLALIAPRGELTYRQLADRVLSLTQGLEAAGLEPGDPIFALLPDDWEQVELRLAAFEGGLMLTAFHASHDHELIQRAAAQVQPKAFVHDAKLAGALSNELVQSIPNITDLPVGSGAAYEQLIAQSPAQRSLHPIDLDAPAGLGFTSGTTGEPKGLFTSHRVIVTSLKLTALNVAVRRDQPDRFLLGIPLVGAGSGVVLPMLFSGATLIIPPRYDVDALVGAIERHDATRTFITPSLLLDLLDHPAADLSSLRNVIYGTAQMPAPKLREAVRRWGPIFQQGYGMAEVLPPVSLLSMQDHGTADEPAPLNVLRSAGEVVPEVEVRIVDSVGNHLPSGEIGEIAIDSPTTFSGYWQRPDLTAAALQDGWYRTGDFGRFDDEGRLHVLGRRSDVIQRDERLLFPIWIEESAHEHPGVHEACLVDHPSRDGTLLVVSPRRAWQQEGREKELKRGLREHLRQSLEAWLLPTQIEVWPELPRSYLAKVLRREVRQEFTRSETRRGA